MLHSERTFKIKVKSDLTVSKILLTPPVISLKEFCMEMKLSMIFKTTNVTKLNKAILISSYKFYKLHLNEKHENNLSIY